MFGHIRHAIPTLVFVLLGPLVPPCFAQTEGTAVCGDGVVEGAEQCDDGNLYRLDGCDSDCRYEQIQRLTSLALQGSPAPGFCDSANSLLGDAFSDVALDNLNGSLQDSIDTGDLTLLLDFLDLDDATGTNDGSLELGVLGGSADPTDPSPGGLDAWFLAADDLVDSSGLPTQRLTPAAIASLQLSAGPDDVSVPFVEGELSMRSASAAARVDAETSLPAEPPSNLAPGFAAFESLDAADASHGLCGNVTVGSLALIPVPELFTSGVGTCEACANSRAYVSCGTGPVTDACHSFLDVLVGGCQILSCVVTLIDPSQPDVGVGVDPPNTLIFEPSGGGIDKVTVVEADDAYSSWFQFTSERVHLTNNLPLLFEDGFESGDTSAWSATVSP